MRGAFKASGLGRSVVSAHGSRMKGATRLQTDPCYAAGTGWLSWSTRRVHRGAVVHAERVQRDRVEKIGLGFSIARHMSTLTHISAGAEIFEQYGAGEWRPATARRSLKLLAYPRAAGSVQNLGAELR